MSVEMIPPPANSKQPGIYTSLLYNGSRFKGHHMSRGWRYEVDVVLQNVVEHDSFLTGNLIMKDENVHYDFNFEGEIISQRYPFLTRKWGINADIDKRYWSKFSTFDEFESTFNSDCFDYNALKQSDYIFMRWKNNVAEMGSTNVFNTMYFDGFYYICLQKSTKIIKGLFCYQQTEMHEILTLRHIPERSSQVYEIR